MYKTIEEEYFAWLVDIVDTNRYSKCFSYEKLLAFLHSKEFRYVLPMDSTRADRGIDLRSRFMYEVYDIIGESDIYGPCSVLELMVALAVHCEEIMDDPLMGNRTGQWFWGMVRSLGLGTMTDSVFDECVVGDIIERFLDRDYEPDGRGGLFTIRGCDCDLRDVEIWHQLCWYLDTIA